MSQTKFLYISSNSNSSTVSQTVGPDSMEYGNPCYLRQMNEIADWSLDDEHKLKLLIQLNDEFICIANEAKDRIPDGDYPLSDFVFIGFFNRYIDTITSTNILLQHYKEKRNVETSIGLTFRASLLDFMIAVYIGTYELEIDDIQPETQKKFDEALTNFICDQIKYSIKHLELAYKSQIITYLEYSNGLKNFHDKHSAFFTHFDEKNLSGCLKGKKFSITDVFNRIHQNKQLKHLSQVYDYYTFYSKYDHFGILTNSMQNMPVSEEFARIRLSYDYIYKGLISATLKLSETHPELLKYGYDLQVLYKKFLPLISRNKL